MNFESREFVLFARKAVTSSEFSLDDLPGSGGRMDLVARCIANALWVSRALRRDSCIHVVAYGKPSPPLTISFYGDKLRGVNVDERNIASWIKKVIGEQATNPGITKRKIGFEDLIRELANQEKNFYILHEKGKDIREIEIKERPVFILGDHIGLPKKLEKFVERFNAEKISLGKVSYLSSQCIAILHYELDRKKFLKQANFSVC
jgi:tRNA (pseudouridine54-N1)-methyltransferase